MDLVKSKNNVEAYKEEVEKCKLSTLSNSEPASMITGIRDLKNVLASLNQETKRVIASYKRSKLFEKAKQAATDFRCTYDSAKVFVRSCNDKLSQMNLDRQSSLETMSHVYDQVQDGGLSPHHEGYHSRDVERDPEDSLNNPTRRDHPVLRSSSRSIAPTRLTLENKENEAKDHVLAALRTPQGLSNESSDKLHEYVGKIKSKFLVYKEVYLDFREWLSAHGSTAEQVQRKVEYGDILLECNFLIRRINDILKYRNMETCSVLGSIAAPMAQDDEISLGQLSLLDAWESPMLAEVVPETQPKVRFAAGPTAPSKELGPSDSEKQWLDDLADRFDRHLSSIKNSAESPKESNHDHLAPEPVNRSGNYLPPSRTNPDVERRQHLAAERDSRFTDSARIYPNLGEFRGTRSSSQDQGNLSRRRAPGAEHHRVPTWNPSSYYDHPAQNRRASTVPNRVPDNCSRYPDFDSNSVVRSQVRSDLYRGMLDPFDGSPEKFQSWRAQLLSHLGEARCSPTDCINIILKNTVGKPKLVVQDYMNNCSDEPESTLEDIWEELERRFGSNSLVSKCLLDKIHDFDTIESSDHIHEMERLLSVCRSAKSKMRTCRQLQVLNYQSELRRIWEKMPQSFQVEWKKKFIRIERGTGDSPTLEVLLDSISDFIDQNSHPVFISKKNSKPTKPARVLHTSITPSAVAKVQEKAVDTDKSPQKHCIFHDKPGHDLPICYMFKKLSMQDKKKFAFERRLCYLCLQPHFADKCPGTVVCTICKGSHIDSMHREPSVPSSQPLFSRIPAPPPRSQNSGSDLWRRGNFVQPQRSICTMVCGEERAPQKCCSKTLLVQVRIAGQQNYITCYCILDEQSNSSFCDPILPSSFGLSPPRRTYALSTMSGYKSKIDGGIVTGLEARGVGEKRWLSLPELLTHPSIPDTKAEVATRDMVNAHPHISHLSANFPTSAFDCKVLLLLGVNCGDAMYTQVYGETYPFAHHTALGWCLVGPVCRDSIRQEDLKALRTTVMQECEHFSTKTCFDTKIKSDLIPRDFDVASYSPEDEFPGMSREERRFQDIIEAGVHPNARGNFEMPLPFKDNPEFPDNRKAVYMRTRNSLLRIKKDEVVLEKCLATMGSYINAGHVEQLNPSDRGIVGRTNYIAVFPVTHPNKPGKVRIVFDSAASYSGSSLNDKLLRGPDVTNKLIGVLMRFRLGKIAFAADVECMFHSFYVSPEDRDALRFYWWDSNDPSKEVTTYRANVHIFGNKSSPAVATFGLRYTTTDEDAADLIEAKKFILHNFYVDDGMGCANTVEEAVSTLEDARRILSKYNIRLHKIISPHPGVLSAFPESELAPELTSLDISSNCSQSALGIRWNIGTDTFNLKCFSPRTEFTRRAVLSVNGSVFDPLGMVSPVSLGGRLLQRKFISSGTEPFGWDDPLPEEFLCEWNSWIQNLADIPELLVPRYIFSPYVDGPSKMELHVFCDASKEAIGHVVYMRTIYPNGYIHVSFLFANSKVAPRSANTIPRLELCAAVEAAQSSFYIKTELQIQFDMVQFHCDSMIVLGYIRNKDKSFSKYVETRVGVILRYSSEKQWTYIPTSENPADIATRPRTPSELKNSKWFDGPSFLLNSYTFENDSLQRQQSLPETITLSRVLVAKEDHSSHILEHLLAKHFSWRSTVRIVGHIKRFISLCRKIPIGEDLANREATSFLVREIQKQSFLEDYLTLRSGRSLQNSNPLAPLCPFLDSNGVIRVGGRLSSADLPYHEKHPQLLPADHRLTEVIAIHCHELAYHQGRHITAAYVRHEGFHIHRMRKTISQVLKKCVLCLRLRGSLQTQIMADLPADRLDKVAPFTRSGVDVFGPYGIHDGKSTRRTSSSKKVWVVLFTCLYSRAVHLEPISSLDTASFNLCLRRFTAIRGRCSFFRSDCGTNFVGFRNQLKDADVREMLSTNDSNGGPEWKFLPPHASHFAGVWERKVGSIKRVLNASVALLGNRTLSREEFNTLIQEAASVVNNTPLGAISSDPNDPFPVTPASLLTLREGVIPEREQFNEKDVLSYGQRRWRRIQYLADQFWSRWRRDYLHGLQVRRKWLKTKRDVRRGDVVLIKDTCPRNSWPMGVVTESSDSKDGHTRSVSIRLKPLGNESTRVIRRAIHDLIILVPTEPDN